MSTRVRAALVTVAIGPEYHRVAREAYPLMLDYANRCGMDFVAIGTKWTGAPAHFEKMHLHGLLEDYERLVFVDADVLIAPDCPNLLECVPADAFGAYLVSNDTTYHDHAVIRAQELFRDIGWKRDYFNTGVMVVSQAHRRVFDRNDPDFDAWVEACASEPEKYQFYDQTYINFKVFEQKVPLFDIGYRFNHTLARGNSEERYGSYMIHCKGHRRGGKLREIRRARAILERPLLQRLFTQFPLLTVAYDQIP